MREGAGRGAGHQRRDQVSLGVDFEESVERDRFAPGFEHLAAVAGVIPFEPGQFPLLERCAGIALYAADTLAGLVVAGKVLLHHVLGHKDVAYLDNGAESSAHCTTNSHWLSDRASNMALMSEALTALMRSL